MAIAVEQVGGAKLRFFNSLFGMGRALRGYMYPFVQNDARHRIGHHRGTPALVDPQRLDPKNLSDARAIHVRKWLDVDKVDAVVDVPNSAVKSR